MKTATALKNSIVGAWVATALVFVAAVVTFCWPNIYTAIFLAVAAIALLGDLVNVVYIKLRARKDPKLLNEQTT